MTFSGGSEGPAATPHLDGRTRRGGRSTLELRSLHAPGLRGIAGQGQVAADRVVVLEVLRKDSLKVDLVQHYDVVQAIPSERTDDPLRIRVLPRGPRRRDATKKSSATRSLRWLSRNARHVGEGGLRRRSMYFATVDTATSMPSLASSLRMRGAPQVTFARDILRIRPTTSGASRGRPGRRARLTGPETPEPVPVPTDHRRRLDDGQSLPPARPDMREDYPEAAVPPPRRTRRLPRVRVSTPICCRSAGFSSTSSRRGLKSDLIVPRSARTSFHTHGTVAAQAHAVQPHPRGWVFGNHSVSMRGERAPPT